MTTSPIADLSYRNYDGPLEAAKFRWWVIAKTTIRMALKKKIMWFFMALSAWYYLAMVFVLYVMDQIGQSTGARPGQPNPLQAFMERIVWKDQFLHGFSFGQITFMMITLAIGAGAIANDNRANALLVYLSKPCTKTDYLLGKWMGVFLTLLATMIIPSLFFFAYGALSYRAQGFFFQDRWLFLKLLAIFPLGAAVHSSLIVGFSSLFNQGRIAGAAYAGLYFLTNFFTKLMTVAWINLTEDKSPAARETPTATLVGNLFYGSIDGLNIGMAKAILHTEGSPYFGLPGGRGLQQVLAPPLVPTLAICAGVIGVSLFIAWTRIRAVEVVG